MRTGEGPSSVFDVDCPSRTAVLAIALPGAGSCHLSIAMMGCASRKPRKAGLGPLHQIIKLNMTDPLYCGFSDDRIKFGSGGILPYCI